MTRDLGTMVATLAVGAILGCAGGPLVAGDGTKGAGSSAGSKGDAMQAGDATQPVVDSGQRETAILAGGCFWGMEELIRAVPGVVETEVGYAGGVVPQATYERVKTGRTGHAESIRVTFDPAALSFEQLLEFFFKIHDPTTPNRQGNDVGTQYRSAVFFLDDAQRATAEAVKAKVSASGAWKRPVVTEVVASGEFWPAESYHQDYLQKHPGGYTCHYVREIEFE